MPSDESVVDKVRTLLKLKNKKLDKALEQYVDALLSASRVEKTPPNADGKRRSTHPK